MLNGPAKRGTCACKACGAENKFPRKGKGPLGRRLFAIEYTNPARKGEFKGRLFKKPDAKDLARAAAAQQRAKVLEFRFAPEQEILQGTKPIGYTVGAIAFTASCSTIASSSASN